MSKISEVLLDHIADYLQFISTAQSFWFMLNTSMTMAATSPVDSVWTRKTMRLCRLSSRRPGVVLSCQLVVASPLAVHSLCRPLVVWSRQLVVASPLTILSLRCPLDVLSCQLVAALPLAILLLRLPLVNLLHQLVVASPLLYLLLRPALPSRPLVAPAGCCVACRRAALSSSRCLVVPPLVVSSRQLVVMPSSLVVFSLHCPLLLSSCWLVVALPVLAPPSCPLVVVQRDAIGRRQTLLLPSNTTATVTIECRLYHPPLPQLPSITTVKHQHAPSSITAVKR